MLKAVVFDMDGVLTETSHQHFIAWRMLAEGLGFTLPDEVKEKVKGISRMESLEIVLAAGKLTDRFSPADKLKLAEQKNSLYQGLIKAFTKDNLAKGALDLLKALKAEHIKVALASVSQNAAFLLEAMELGQYFDAAADPAKLRNGKPAPDIFLMAAELLGVEPKYCIGIEDAFAGIEAIKRAGMKPLGIGGKEVLYNCDIVVPSLRDVDLELLKSLID